MALEFPDCREDQEDHRVVPEDRVCHQDRGDRDHLEAQGGRDHPEDREGHPDHQAGQAGQAGQGHREDRLLRQTPYPAAPQAGPVVRPQSPSAHP